MEALDALRTRPRCRLSWRRAAAPRRSIR